MLPVYPLSAIQRNWSDNRIQRQVRSGSLSRNNCICLSVRRLVSLFVLRYERVEEFLEIISSLGYDTDVEKDNAIYMKPKGCDDIK